MSYTEKEFAAIVESTKKVVLNAIGKTLNPEHIDYIDDVAQETYMRAFSALAKNKFQNKAKLTTWLYKIAQNESLRMNKKLARQNRTQEEAKGAAMEAHQTQEAQYTDPHLKTSPDANSMIHLLLDKLPEKYRCVMELDLQGYQDNQIAEKLNISLGTVKSRNSRAREQMRRMVHQMELVEGM